MLTQLLNHTGYFIRLESSFNHLFSGNVLANAFVNYLEFHAAKELDLTDEDQLLNIPEWCYAGEHSQRRLMNRLLGVCKSRQYLSDVIEWLKTLAIIKTEAEDGKTAKYWINVRKLQNLINQKVKLAYKKASRQVAYEKASTGLSEGQSVAFKKAGLDSDTYIQIDQLNNNLIDPSETQKTQESSSQLEIEECRTDTPSPQEEINKTFLANKNTSVETDFPSGNTEETILRDKLKSLYRQGYRRWSENEITFLRDQLSPFFEVWNTHKFPAFYPVSKPSRQYLYYLLDFLVRENFEDCLELFERAVKALSSDPFWTKQGKDTATDFPDIKFLLEDPDYKCRDHIRQYSDRYRETPQGQQITQEDVEKAIQQKRIRDRAERLRQKYGNQGVI